MNLHEYQAKEVFRDYGIPVPAGRVAASPDEAAAAAAALGGAVWVVKAQVHAGGRGKAGGVKLARDVAAVRAAAADMLGRRLVTPQTTAEGLPISRVYVEAGSDIAREIYLSLTLNREKSRVALIASSAGGMDIEEVAHQTPEKILSVTVHPAAGLQAHQAREIAFGLGLRAEQVGAFQALASALYRLYMEKDLSLVEVNPLIVTKGGALMALDAKINGGRLSTISTTSPSTATSPAWSTAPGSPWRPWTSSSCMAVSRRTSSTWGAVRPPSA